MSKIMLIAFSLFTIQLSAYAGSSESNHSGPVSTAEVIGDIGCPTSLGAGALSYAVYKALFNNKKAKLLTKLMKEANIKANKLGSAVPGKSGKDFEIAKLKHDRDYSDAIAAQHRLMNHRFVPEVARSLMKVFFAAAVPTCYLARDKIKKILMDPILASKKNPAYMDLVEQLGHDGALEVVRSYDKDGEKGALAKTYSLFEKASLLAEDLLSDGEETPIEVEK